MAKLVYYLTLPLLAYAVVAMMIFFSDQIGKREALHRQAGEQFVTGRAGRSQDQRKDRLGEHFIHFSHEDLLDSRDKVLDPPPLDVEKNRGGKKEVPVMDLRLDLTDPEWTPGKGGEGDGGKEPATKIPINALLGQLPVEEQAFSVTLVSQSSENRFWMLPHLCKRWPGPIAVGVIAADIPKLPELCPQMSVVGVEATSEEYEPSMYPVNRLRNAGVHSVNTSHFLMTDIDMWPDTRAYSNLHRQYQTEKDR
ncbi:unnamed protein product [Discosporangium mesarthrocarpum]